MNIVVFTDTFLPKTDGISISLNHFTKILANRGHHFVICAPSYEKKDTIEIHDNVTIIRFKNAPLPSYPDIKIVLPSQKKLKKAMTMYKPDLIHIQTPGLLGQYGVLMAKMYKVPLIGTYHTLVSEQGTYVSLYRLLKVDRLLNFFKGASSNRFFEMKIFIEGSLWVNLGRSVSEKGIFRGALKPRKKVKKRLDKIIRSKDKTIKKRVIMKLCNSLYEAGELIISPSEMIKKELESKGVKKPIAVISNGMDLSRFKGVPKKPSSKIKLLHVGRISFEKNCDVILKAFEIIIESIPDAQLDIVGEGPAITSLKIQVEQQGIQNSVNFLGFLPHSTLHNLYPKYDLFITASTMETQGLVVLEALACGVPCIGVDSFALPELIQNAESGYVVEPFDYSDMAQKCLKVLKDPLLFEKFSRHALRIANNHELHSCADKLEETYFSVLEKNLL